MLYTPNTFHGLPYSTYYIQNAAIKLTFTYHKWTL